MRLTVPARAMLLSVLGESLSGGTLVIYGGDFGSAAAYELAELRFTTFGGVSESGDLEAGPIRSGTALATGTPKWWQARAADGRPVLEGLVGTGEGQLRIEPETLVKGGRVDGRGFMLGW